MKNFTNNFKQFTSRLSARWLIMALMLFLGIGNAWAWTVIYDNTDTQWDEVYLYVGKGDWSECNLKMTEYDTNLFFFNGSGWDDATEIAFGNADLGGSTSGNICSKLKTTSSSTYNYGKDFSKTYKYKATGLTSADKDCSNKQRYYWPDTNARVEVSNFSIKKIQLAGDFNNWGSSTDICYSQSGSTCSFEKELAAKDKYEFKIIIDGTWYSQNAVTVDGSKVTFKNPWDANSSFKASKDGIYTFYVDKDKQVWITYRAACSAPSGVSITGAPTTKPCPGDQVTLKANVGKGDADSYSWSVSGTDWSINNNANTNQTCTFIAGTETGNISLTVSGCSSSDDATTSIEVKSSASKANLTVTDNVHTYDGTAKVANVKWTDTDNSEGITITAPASVKDAGSYTIKVTTSAHGDLCASNGDITLDSKLTISPKTPDENDFVYTDQTVTYNGDAQTATVTWKQGYEKTGEITITYKQGEEVKDPINAGIYDVWVTSAASDNFNATKSAINKGTLRIDLAKITDVPSNFQLSETSYNYGDKAKPTVSLKKQGSSLVAEGLGDITPIYYNSQNEVVADPTAVGTYTVKITMTAGNGYSAITEPTVVGTFEITCYKPINPTLSKTDVTRCNGEPKTRGTITITNYAQYPEGCVFYLDGNIVTPTNEGVIENVYFPTENSKTYTVKVTNTCGSTIQESDETQIAIKATDAAPSIGDFEIKYNVSSVCSGTIVQLEATHVNGATYAWYKGNSQDAIDGATDRTYSPSITENSTYRVTVTKTSNGCSTTKEAITGTITAIPQADAPQITPNYMNVCGGDAFKLPNIDGVTWSLDGKPTTGSQPGIANNTDAAIIKTFQAVKEVDGCPSAPADYIVTVNPTPVITGESVAQPGKANAINLKLQDNLVADWSVDPTADFSYTTNINSTAFSAETNGTYTITATTKEGCSATHVVTVADAFYVYMRQPKKGETAYNNFYYPTQNPTQGGDLFYKEYSSIPPAEGYTDYNQGGRDHDVILTDCDGYVWYGFKASAQLIAGTNYFTVHAPNKNGYDGWFTHTDITKPGKMTGDIYYIMGTEGNGSSGWKIEEASAPYAGPKVHTLGSTTLGADKFAALYVTDCSGKEIDAYQWEYCRTQDGDYQPYSSVCSYTFEKKDVVKTETSDAGKTNNIRPSEFGYYRCKVTYKDGKSATSAAVSVTGSYSRSFTSNIPVLVVNTGSKGFPDCTGLSNQTASKNASTFKAKRSVDVKIYEGKTLVYDRKARMNYRGSSSLNFVKKSYAFCPGDANCGDKDKGEDYVKTAKLNMLGVGKACDKDWVLYAAAADPSLMRNRLVFDSYNAMTGKWGVNSRYVELIVDGVYKGVYVFMDKITMNTERVKVDEDKGFIVKFDKTDREDRVGGLNGVLGDEKTFKTSDTGKDDISTYDTSIDQRFEIEYPEKDDYKTGWKARVDGIQGMFQAFEDALKQGDYATVQKYIDYTSWADWFIINEFTKNVDAYRASCIFVYTGEAGAKIEARPLWDQELSFNNQASKGTSDKGSDSTTGLLIQHSNVYSDDFKAPFWFTGGGSDITGGLLSDPCFVQVVKERWNIHQLGALSKKSLEDLVDEYEDDLAPEGTTENALTRETAFWDGKSRGNCDCSYDTGNATATGYQNKTFAESTGTITSWIADGAGGRREGLTTAINGLTGASFSIQIIPSVAYTTPWEPVEIAVSVTPAGYDYKLEYTGDNNLGGVANTIIKEEGDKIIYRIPRPWEAGDAAERRADIEYGIKATLSVQEGTTVCGNQAAPSSTAKIILQDEPNDNCK